jgi:hypothetical protein
MSDQGSGSGTHKILRRISGQDNPNLDQENAGNRYDEYRPSADDLKSLNQFGLDTPKGMPLNGYDNMDEAVEELNEIDESELETIKSFVIELPPYPLIGGESAYGRVVLKEKLASEVSFYFHSSKEETVKLPPVVSIPGGRKKITFPISTFNPSRAIDRVKINALLPDMTMFSGLITVRYNLGLWVR